MTNYVFLFYLQLLITLQSLKGDVACASSSATACCSNYDIFQQMSWTAHRMAFPLVGCLSDPRCHGAEVIFLLIFLLLALKCFPIVHSSVAGTML